MMAPRARMTKAASAAAVVLLVTTAALLAAPAAATEGAAPGYSGNWVEPKCNPDVPYCGGNHGSLIAEASCTSYPFKPRNMATMASEWCAHNKNIINNFAGKPDGAGVWRAWDASNNKWAPDYWVIHGCDGAGLMGDCKLGAQYFEHIYPADYKTAWTLNDDSRYAAADSYNDVTDKGFSCSPTPNGGWNDVKRCNVPHTRRPFRHPGTGMLHQVDAGMWDWTSIKDVCNDRAQKKGDCGKPWSHVMPFGAEKTTDWYWSIARELNNNRDPVAIGYVVTYPWVCNKWSGVKKWGSGGNWEGSPGGGKSLLEVFWGTSDSWNAKGVPYGSQRKYVECYFDNEPYDMHHSTSIYPPPAWEAYMFYKPTDKGNIFMVKIGNKAFSSPQGVAYSREEVKNPKNRVELSWYKASVGGVFGGCPPGFATLEGSATNCTTCAPGFGGTNCTVCDRGTFSPGGDGKRPTPACTACMARMYTADPGATSAVECAVCKPGYGGPTCQKCKAGTFSPGGTSDNATASCQPCPAGTTTKTTQPIISDALCTRCLPGFGGANCDPCTIGSWSKGATSATPRPPCTPCVAGTNTTAPGAKSKGDCKKVQ